MSAYRTREIAEVLGLTPRQVRAYVYAGLLAPERGPQNHYRFSFHDVVMLRLGRPLFGSIARPKVSRALKAIPQYLEPGVPLASVSVDALGEVVIARDSQGVWDPETGQRYFEFTLPGDENSQTDRIDDPDVVSLDSRRSQVEAVQSTRVTALTEGEPEVGEARRASAEAAEWYERGLEMEHVDVDRAKAAYRRAILADACLAAPHANLGRLLYEEGELKKAAEHFGRAFELDQSDATAAYNLGVAFEDLGNREAALESYQRALTSDPTLAVAHFNLSRLHEATGDRAAALRHLAEYRRLESCD